MKEKKEIFLEIKIFIFIFFLVIFFFSFTKAYDDAGGYFICYNCSDCMAALNNNLYNEVRLGTDIFDHENTCINNPSGFSNKVFDCQGYTIDGINTSSYNGFVITSKLNVTIKNCIIKEFNVGIYFSSTNNSKLFNNTIYNNNIGVYLRDYSFTNEIINNTISHGYSYNVYLSQSSNNILINNEISNSKTGIYLYQANNNNILNNRINNNIERGILDYLSSNNTISNNTLLGNYDGIIIHTSSDENINNNTIINCSRNALYLYYATNNNFSNNTATNNAYDYYSQYSSNNLIKNLKIDVDLVISFQENNISLKKSVAITPPQGYKDIEKFIDIRRIGENAWIFLNISYDDSKVLEEFGIDESTLRIWKYSEGVWYNESFYTVNDVDTVNDVVYANITSFSIFAPLGIQTTCICSSCSECNQKLNDETCIEVKLISNILTDSICIDNPENFTGKTLNCRGKSFLGNKVQNSYAIYIDNKSNITIKGCKIINFDYGIIIYNSSFINLINNNIKKNNFGLYIFDSFDLNISNNSICYNTNYDVYASNEINGTSNTCSKTFNFNCDFICVLRCIIVGLHNKNMIFININDVCQNR